MNKREFQSVHIDKIYSSVYKNDRIIGQLPTGGGKTVEFSFLAQRYIRETGNSVLILVHRKELMQQAAKTIKKITGISPVLITSQSKQYFISRIYIGMVESTVKRIDLFDNVGLVIIDECHIANFNKIHSLFISEMIIGFSATPISSSKKDPLNKYYRDIIVGPPISELIKLGFLSQNITRCPKDVIDAKMFDIDQRKGEYNEKQMSQEYMAPKNVMNTVKAYQKYCRGKKTIIFNVSIEHSKDVNESFLLCGYNSRHLDANSPDRDEILEWFKITEDAILCNVMIATVGFDEPTIHNVILNFSTLSLAKYLQCCGRGGRIIDDYFIDSLQSEYPYKLQHKSYFNILDMGGNHVNFGDWNDDRDWEHIYNHPPKPGEGIAPKKTCPECEGLVHASSMVCPLKNAKGEDCLYEFQKKKIAEEKDLEKMILITKGIDVDKLIGLHNKKYEYYTFFEIGVDIAKSMFSEVDYPTNEDIIKYFKVYYSLCCEWWNKAMSGKNGNIESIDNSQWHITRAKNNFYSLYEKYKPAKIINLNSNETKLKHLGYSVCISCDKSTKEECECGEPYCETCKSKECFCPKCIEFSKQENRLNRGY